MEGKELEAIAWRVIDSNQFMTIGTADDEGGRSGNCAGSSNRAADSWSARSSRTSTWSRSGHYGSGRRRRASRSSAGSGDHSGTSRTSASRETARRMR